MSGPGATLRAAEVSPVDPEIVEMETLVTSAVTLATLQKQLFVKARTAQVCRIVNYNL